VFRGCSCSDSRQILAVSIVLRLVLGRKEIAKIDGGVFGGVLETEFHLRLAQATVGVVAIAVGSRVTGAKLRFDEATEFTANAFEAARDAGFVLAEKAPDLGQGFLLRIVEIESAVIAWVQRLEGCVQSGDETSQVFLAMRIEWRTDGRLRGGQGGSGVTVCLLQALPAAMLTNFVDMALCQNGTQPGPEGTAAMKVAEKGTLPAFAIGQPVELSEERIGEFLCVNATAATFGHGGCSSAKAAAVIADEAVPSRFGTMHATAGEAQVLDVECSEVFLELVERRTAGSKALANGALESKRKLGLGHTPTRCTGLGIEGVQAGGTDLQKGRKVSVVAEFRVVWHVRPWSQVKS